MVESAGEAFDIIWGHKMGSSNLGLRLNRSFVSNDNGTTTTEGDGNNGRNILGFGGGYDTGYLREYGQTDEKRQDDRE